MHCTCSPGLRQEQRDGGVKRDSTTVPPFPRNPGLRVELVPLARPSTKFGPQSRAPCEHLSFRAGSRRGEPTGHRRLRAALQGERVSRSESTPAALFFSSHLTPRSLRAPAASPRKRHREGCSSPSSFCTRRARWGKFGEQKREAPRDRLARDAAGPTLSARAPWAAPVDAAVLRRLAHPCRILAMQPDKAGKLTRQKANTISVPDTWRAPSLQCPSARLAPARRARSLSQFLVEGPRR